MEDPNTISLEEALDEAFRIIGQKTVIESIRASREQERSQDSEPNRFSVVDAQDQEAAAEGTSDGA